MIADGPKEKLARAFDRTQDTFEAWSEKITVLQKAKMEESQARKRYDDAKFDWLMTVRTCSPSGVHISTIHEKQV